MVLWRRPSLRLTLGVGLGRLRMGRAAGLDGPQDEGDALAQVRGWNSGRKASRTVRHESGGGMGWLAARRGGGWSDGMRPYVTTSHAMGSAHSINGPVPMYKVELGAC